MSVTWCFGGCSDVVVDGRAGYPACGEAVVPVVQSRRIEVVGRNRSGVTPVGTATVVAMAAPQLYLPTPSAPPPVVLRTDVSAALTPVAPITGRLDEFWSVRDGARTAASGGPSSGGLSSTGLGLVGVPASVTARLRGAFRTTGGGEK